MPDHRSRSRRHLQAQSQTSTVTSSSQAKNRLFRSLDFLGYPHYKIKMDGTVWSKYSGEWKQLRFDRSRYPDKIRKLWMTSTKHRGYYVRLWNNGRCKHFLVSELLLLAFVSGRGPVIFSKRHAPP